MSYRKQKSLTLKLAELTRVGEIDWQQAFDADAFQVSFRDNTIKIKPVRNSEGNQDIEIQLVNEGGQTVETFTDVDLTNEDVVDSTNWFAVMSEIYEMARRTALGAEKVIDEILEDLDKLIPF